MTNYVLDNFTIRHAAWRADTQWLVFAEFQNMCSLMQIRHELMWSISQTVENHEVA
jgi:hypothetical protein